MSRLCFLFVCLVACVSCVVVCCVFVACCVFLLCDVGVLGGVFYVHVCYVVPVCCGALFWVGYCLVFVVSLRCRLNVSLVSLSVCCWCLCLPVVYKVWSVSNNITHILVEARTCNMCADCFVVDVVVCFVLKVFACGLCVCLAVCYIVCVLLCMFVLCMRCYLLLCVVVCGL